MKISTAPTVFNPVTITFETQDEAKAILAAIRYKTGREHAKDAGFDFDEEPSRSTSLNNAMCDLYKALKEAARE